LLAEKGQGKARAIRRRALCKKLKCGDPALRIAKQQKVAAGIAICARKESPGGYYLAQTTAEIDESKAIHLSLLHAAAVAIKGLDRARRAMTDHYRQRRLIKDVHGRPA